MPKVRNTKSKKASQVVVTSTAPEPGHLQVTVSGPAKHVMAALTNMKLYVPVTPALCQQIALTETNASDAQLFDKLGDLNMISPESRTAYTQRCALDLKAHTGYNVDPAALPQSSDTTVQQVAEAMFNATT